MKKLAPYLLLLSICILFATTSRAQAPEQARNFQINTTHTGSITSETLKPPLKVRWSVNFGQPISYPLIADGKVYVTVKNATSGTGTTLFALEATDGSLIWAQPLGGSFPWSAACYENGRVFALNGSGLLRAFDGATGNLVWSAVFGQSIFNAPPTVSDGVVYVSGPSRVLAINANTGAELWTSSVINGDTSSPAIGDGVYVSYSCPNVYKLDLATGAKIWQHAPGCSGGGAKRLRCTTDAFMCVTFPTLSSTARPARLSETSMRRILPPFPVTGASF